MVASKMLKVLWEAWDLRIVILLSLVLQILLIFLAPLRKRVSKALINVPLWLAYLVADLTANFATGLISKSQGDTLGPFANPTLLAFWAPFLLVHLGGPDTITAFALEDNELWLRHLLGLGFQCWAVAYAFFQSLPNHKFLVPTLLMFLAGVIKYIERTRALYLASSRRFKESLLTKPDPGPNYAKLMDEYTSKIDARLPTKIEMIPEPIRVNRAETAEDRKDLTDLEVVEVAHNYFKTFKGLIADLIFSFRERNTSRDYFLKRSARDAFKIVEVELNFFYEILYTKATVVTGMLGYAFRLFSFILSVAALLVFHFIKKNEFEKFDIGISYILLAGAIALDVIASFMVLRSDWTAVALKSDHPNRFIKFFRMVLWVERDRWPKSDGEKPKRFTRLGFMPIVHLRWSESLSQYNLIDCCLDPRPELWEKFIDLLGLTNMLDGLKYVKNEGFTTELRDFIFEELKMKSELADDLETAREIFNAKGDWILRFESCTDLLPWISEVDFDESIILWHIATDLCYYPDKYPDGNGKPTSSGNSDINTSANGSGNPRKSKRELSKVFSDYMLYLLIMQSTMLSTMAGIGQIRFRDTCAEAKKFFDGRKIGKSKEEKICCLNTFTCKCLCGNEPKQGQSQGQTRCCFNKCCCKGEKVQCELQKKACKSILAVNTVVEPVAVKGDRSKSVLFDASMLAQELEKLGSERMWKIISKVWVELMSYAAGRCRASTHVAQLSKGGELLTLVWLLMAHLGLGNQFQISEGHARAKLIVRK